MRRFIFHVTTAAIGTVVGVTVIGLLAFVQDQKAMAAQIEAARSGLSALDEYLSKYQRFTDLFGEDD